MKNILKMKYTALLTVLIACFSFPANAQSCGDGTYEFADMVAIFQANNCTGCHGGSGGLNLSDYTNVTVGGNRGMDGCGPYATALDFLVGKVDGSLTAADACGNAMPNNSTPFGTPGIPTEDIAAIQTWIDAGAPEFCPLPACTDIVVSAQPVCNGTPGTFDIQINTITGGDGLGDSSGTYTVTDGTNTITYPTQTTITGLAYTNQNDKITLTVTDDDDNNCSISYDVLQLECLDQTVCDCTATDPFSINAQVSANGDGYSMVYVVTDNGGIVIEVNQTGSFGAFPDDGMFYNVFAYNVADADLAGLEADLNGLIGSLVDPSLTASQAPPFDTYFYTDTMTSFIEDCECCPDVEIIIDDQTICSEDAIGYDLTSLEPAGFTDGVWQDADGNIVSTVDIADGDTFLYTYTDSNDCVYNDTLTFTVNDGTSVVVDVLLCPEDATTPYDLTQNEPAGTNGTWDVADPMSVDVSSGGTFTYTYDDANGCTSRVEVGITISGEIVFTVNDITLCEGQTGTLEPSGLDDLGNYTYAWDDGTTTPTLSVNLAGDYTLSVMDFNGCVASQTATVTVLSECDETCATTQTCDDNNPCTENDMETIGANAAICIPCAGTVNPSSCEAGCVTTQTCDDSDPLTINDMEGVAADGTICVPCAGVPADVCSDTTVESCDDGNPCTIDDEQTVSNLDNTICIPCAGTVNPSSCEAGCVTTQTCDDSDPLTTNDMEGVAADGTICVPCAGVLADACSDTTVESCDDGNPCTIDDEQTVSNLDNTICIPCAGTVNPSSCEAGCVTTQTCDDSDPLTINDMEGVAADGTICVPCAGVPADVCSDTTVESCDDGNPCTIGDEQTVSNLDNTICIPCAGTAIPAVDATFAGLTTDYCEGATVEALPTTDDNGITGTWSPTTIDNTTSGTYTFAPDDTQCANSFTLDVTITPTCDVACTTTQACDDGDACTENDMETIGSNGIACVPCTGTPAGTVSLTESAVACEDDALTYDLTAFEPAGSTGTWVDVADPTSADVSAGGPFVFNFTNDGGCDGTLDLSITVLDDIQITAAPTCDSATDGIFFVAIQDITGGSQASDYTVEANGLSVNYTGTPVTIGPFDYTDHNTGITLNVTSSDGCTATYDVLQLNCADQEVCDCENSPDAPYTITAQAAANGNGYSMVYALVNNDNANTAMMVNDTGIFIDLNDNTNYTVYAFNVEDVDVVGFTADLNGLMMISAGDEVLMNMGAFASYCYESASAAFIEDCACLSCDDFVINASTTDLTCNGDAGGAIDLTVLNGQTPYTYTWSNGETTEDLTGLDGGAYTVTVNDAGECSDIITVTISEPDAIGISDVAITNPNCSADDGTIVVSVANGVAPFTYEITELGISQIDNNTITGVPAGSYTLVVTDTNGCTTSTPVTLIGTDTPIATIAIDTAPDCGEANGTITVTATGGTAPYEYAWDDAAAQTTATATGLTGGIYTVVVTDADGCSATESITLLPVGCEFSITNTFFASDPCKCNNDQSANDAGDGTFEETVTVLAPAGLIVRADVTSTGIEDPINLGLSTSTLPIEFYESFPGRYILIFNHIDRIGYTINLEYSTDDGLTFIPMPNGFGGQLSYTNVCAYPVLAFNPPLEEAYCEDDGIVVIGVIETSDNVDFTPLAGFPSVQLNNDEQEPSPATFDPTTFGTATYTFSGFYNYENGTGTGGTVENPAVSLNPCATFIRVNVPVNPVPVSAATCEQTGAEEFIIDVDPMDDYETPENLMYRIGDSGPFQTSDQFIVGEDGDYDMTVVDMVSACQYEVPAVCFRQLPIELISFEGTCADGKYVLTWTTATEEDVLHFVVERSIDGQNYVQIAEVDAVGNSTALQTYGYKDATGVSREYYYRLRVIELSGTETLSRIETISCLTGGFGVLDVYPNPTQDEVAISFEVTSRDQLKLTLVDVLGRSVSEQNITPDIGLNRAIIDMSTLPAAMYYIVLADGTQQSIEKVVKK